MEPLISVIVPVYKVEGYLDKCVQSIVDQTYQNLEIILVDDGSPDNCPQMCDEWARKDNRIKVIHQANGGVSVARNNGIKIATGDFIYAVDSDDFIVHDLCERVMEIFCKYPIDIVMFNCERVAGDGTRLGGTERFKSGMMNSFQAIEELLKGNICEYIWSKMYRAKLIKGIQFPVGRYFEDSAVMYRLLLNANGIYTLNEKLYFYLQHSDSIVATMNAKKLGDLYQARKERYDTLKTIDSTLAELAFSKVALNAIRLYDRSLWEQDDILVLNDAKVFLEQHRERLLKAGSSSTYKLFFYAPRLYDILRKGKHLLAKIIRIRK